MNLKPLGDRVIVKQAEAETQTKSGLILADTAKEKPQKGTVIAVGEGKWDEDGEKRIALDVKAGDTVIYSKYGGTEVKVEGEDYLILRADPLRRGGTPRPCDRRQQARRRRQGHARPQRPLRRAREEVRRSHHHQ